MWVALAGLALAEDCPPIQLAEAALDAENALLLDEDVDEFLGRIERVRQLTECTEDPTDAEAAGRVHRVLGFAAVFEHDELAGHAHLATSKTFDGEWEVPPEWAGTLVETAWIASKDADPLKRADWEPEAPLPRYSGTRAPVQLDEPGEELLSEGELLRPREPEPVATDPIRRRRLDELLLSPWRATYLASGTFAVLSGATAATTYVAYEEASLTAAEKQLVEQVHVGTFATAAVCAVITTGAVVGAVVSNRRKEAQEPER